MGDVSGGNAPISIMAAKALFAFEKREPETKPDYFTVRFGGEGIPILSKKTYKASSLDFRFKVRSPHYYGILLIIDGKMVTYSRGHWINAGTLVGYNGEHRLPGKVESADSWKRSSRSCEMGLSRFRSMGRWSGRKSCLHRSSPANMKFSSASVATSHEARSRASI